jgi:hypothetical protein
MIKKFLRTINDQRATDYEVELYRNLMRREAKIGGTLFGPIPAGHRREFFCLDEHTWVWYEEWVDQAGKQHVINTRYDIRPSGIIKKQQGHANQYVEFDEARNLYRAVMLYVQRVTALPAKTAVH